MQCMTRRFSSRHCPTNRNWKKISNGSQLREFRGGFFCARSVFLLKSAGKTELKQQQLTESACDVTI
jgi:hypothetical protein